MGIRKKIGRNDPCPCGSGKKYKNCCLPKLQTSKQQPAANEIYNQGFLAVGDKKQIEASACHEAGHLLMAVIFRVPIEYCEVNSRGEGHTHSLTGDWYNEQPAPQRAAAVALINIAGPTFECSVGDGNMNVLFRAAAADHQQAGVAMTKVLGPVKKDQVSKALGMAVQVASELCGRCQNFINRIADVLIAKGRLEKGEIEAFVQVSEEVAAVQADMADGTWLDSFVTNLTKEAGVT